MYGVKITGPQSDKEAGWAVRNQIDRNGNIFVGIRSFLSSAEKFKTMEEAEEVAFLLAAQRPHLLGRIRIMKLKELGIHRWTVERPCT